MKFAHSAEKNGSPVDTWRISDRISLNISIDICFGNSTKKRLSEKKNKKNLTQSAIGL